MRNIFFLLQGKSLKLGWSWNVSIEKIVIVGVCGRVDKFFVEIFFGYAYRGLCFQEKLSVIRLIVHLIIKSIKYFKIVFESQVYILLLKFFNYGQFL